MSENQVCDKPNLTDDDSENEIDNSNLHQSKETLPLQNDIEENNCNTMETTLGRLEEIPNVEKEECKSNANVQNNRNSVIVTIENERTSNHGDEDSRSDYDNLSDMSETEEADSLLPSVAISSSRPIPRNEAVEKLGNQQSSTTYVPCNGKHGGEMKPLKFNNHEIEVLMNTPTEEERSWVKALSNAKNAAQKQRLQFLSSQRQNHGTLPYKAWLLGLTKKHRFEIIIALGLLIWIAFFIGLAIVVNTNNSDSTQDGTIINNANGQSDGKSFPPTVNDTFTSIANTSVTILQSEHKIPTTTITEKPETTDQLNQTRMWENYASTNVLNHGSIQEDVKFNHSSFHWFPNNVINYTKDATSFNSTEDLIKGMPPNYKIGIGRADITGPAADVNMMGYANPSQTSGGIHFRQFSRAFIVADPLLKKRAVFVNIDACMASTLLKLEVMKRLTKKFGDLYTEENVCISGTHTHSAPAGFLQDVLFQITSLGYVPETLNAMVNGIVKSIELAHDKILPGFILINKGELLDTNINRSPTAYLLNTVEERSKYEYNVDKEMTLIKFLDASGKGIGMINWFPVHCTSMNNTNTLISGDNKGYAELMFEAEMDPDALPGESSFVAAFAQSNEGDVSPNTHGPHCKGTNISCSNEKSTCNGKVQDCIATGPGKDMFESTKIIGTNQLNKALSLYNSASIMLEGPVQFIHQYINMSDYEIKINSTFTTKTCPPAMGFSFAAGTTDGPGAFNFKQGDTSGGMFWKIVRGFLHDPTQKQHDCHFPKPILIDTGEMSSPYSWQPKVVDNQILRFGQFLMIAVPGEFTTMAGRRVRETVLKTLASNFPNEKFDAVIAGLSNTYSDYITTFEEYKAQRYEGASTIYGPYTLHAYIDHYEKLTTKLAKNEPAPKLVEPENFISDLYSFTTGVIFDGYPTGYDFGWVLDDARTSYKLGEEVVVKFVAGNPRNTLAEKPETQFSVVEMEQPDGTWKVIHNDASWDTQYIWIRTFSVMGQSEAIIKWKIDPLKTKPGKYRIIHNGHYKYFFNGKIYEYSGTSKIFYVSK